MAIATNALNLLVFPQLWDGNALTLRFLCLPRRDPDQPLLPGGKSFADADLQFEARIIAGLDHLPRIADVLAPALPLLLDEPPTQKAALFAELPRQFDIAPPAAPPRIGPPPTFRKPLTPSYRALVGNRELSQWLANQDDYDCALHEAHADQPVAPVDLARTLAWGQVLAFALRQPKLAMALGLIGQATITPDAGSFAKGGWLHVALQAGSDFGGNPELVTSHAARIPLLDATPRTLYSSQLFPLDDVGAGDQDYPDIARHDRGFARLVHAALGDADGDGIRLAWDDEHVADDFARQVSTLNTRPMATGGYRVDVRDSDAVDGIWHSLQRVTSIGDLMLGPLKLGAYAGEAAVEVVPVQASPALTGNFWMPPYFCTWRGASLVLTDADLTQLHQRLVGDAEAHRLGREHVLEAVSDKKVPLLYGHSYQFRVRLADLSRGGPDVDADTPDNDPGNPAHHVTEIAFLRHRRPGVIEVVERPTAGALRIVIAKPLLRHPELLFTGKHSFADLEAALVDAIAAGNLREAGLPDPDVVTVAIRLEVRALSGERVEWLPLYSTERAFAGDTLTLELAPIDMATLAGLAIDQPADGPLVIPAARDLRVVLVAVGRDTPGYFASEAATLGNAVTVEMRAAASVEPALFAAPPALAAFFCRPAEGVRPLAMIAAETGLDAHDIALNGRLGARTVFGCASALRHIVSPERSSLTLASDAEVALRWVTVLRLELARDWTWDALAEDGIVIRRRLIRPGQADVVEVAGTVTLPRSLATSMLAGIGDLPRDPARASSQIVFVDAVDPKPKPVMATLPGADPDPGQFPTELTIAYEIAVKFRDGIASPDIVTAAVRLPITTPPVQVPKLVSAGIALSPPDVAEDYSSTRQRQRMLWLEFDAPPLDPQDKYFVRALASAPDPVLTTVAIDKLAPEPLLAIVAETMRMITPGQPADDNGLQAMRPLDRPGDGGTTWLVPLPEGLGSDAAALFGMFTYEVRVGHTGAAWSTAQGRFGPPLRIAGVQHPPPPLLCQAARTSATIKVRAPFATPVHGGRHLRPAPPLTQLWAVLYARVEQADAAAWRNLMLLRAPLFAPNPDPARPVPQDAAAPRLYGEGQFALDELQGVLLRHGLAPDAPLTTLVAEFHGGPLIDDPLGRGLGHARLLRVSPLIAVPDTC